MIPMWKIDSSTNGREWYFRVRRIYFSLTDMPKSWARFVIYEAEFEDIPAGWWYKGHITAGDFACSSSRQLLSILFLRTVYLQK